MFTGFMQAILRTSLMGVACQLCVLTGLLLIFKIIINHTTIV